MYMCLYSCYVAEGKSRQYSCFSKKLCKMNCPEEASQAGARGQTTTVYSKAPPPRPTKVCGPAGWDEMDSKCVRVFMDKRSSLITSCMPHRNS